MSRDIRFRGKRLDNSEWVYGGYYKHLSRTPSPIGDRIKENDYEHLIFNSGFSDWNMPKSLECIEVYKNTVGQYTGLKDKNGKEIYEGDIVLVATYSYEEPLLDTTCTIEYNPHYLIYEFVEIVEIEETGERYSMLDIRDNFKSELEVIGNIYENPELLKE